MPVPLSCRDRLGMAISVFIQTPQRYIFFHVSQKISCKKRIIENRPQFSRWHQGMGDSRTAVYT
jgi:hypothetical protein